MNRRIAMSLVLGGAFALSFGLARAQEAPPPPRGEARMQGGPGGPGGEMGEPFGERIEFLGFEGMHGGKVVTGAPFSAVAISESTQTLADGNHITRKTQTNLFRDSQGRFRKEVNLPASAALGPLGVSGQSKSFVFINDPVTSTNFILHSETKTAEKMGKSFGRRKGEMKGAMKDSKSGKLGSRMQEEISNGTLKKEDLGTQTIAGVIAQGTRITKTIPAGQIGNEKPILIVRETWYSNDLQMVVKSARSNPWSGESTYTLTNIQRSEPAASLFAVPSDFTVQEGRAGKRGMGRRRQGPPPAVN
jgi:hypothetical protein